jgi:hypothetical protein
MIAVSTGGRLLAEGTVSSRTAVRSASVQTRYLLIASLVTALLILGASVVWFLMALS